MATTVENVANNLLSSRFGKDLYSRFDKLDEEYNELKEAFSDYKQHKEGSRERVLDELSDLQAVLSHVAHCMQTNTEELLMNAVIKVSIREHNPQYKK